MPDDGLCRRGCRGVSSVITVTVEAKEKGHLCRQDRSAPTKQVTGIQSAFEPRGFGGAKCRLEGVILYWGNRGGTSEKGAGAQKRDFYANLSVFQ